MKRICSTYLEEETYEKFSDAAWRKRKTISGLLREIIEVYLEACDESTDSGIRKT